MWFHEFSKQISANLLLFPFPGDEFYTQNLSNRCRRKYDPLISRFFKILFLAGFCNLAHLCAAAVNTQLATYARHCSEKYSSISTEATSGKFHSFITSQPIRYFTPPLNDMLHNQKVNQSLMVSRKVNVVKLRYKPHSASNFNILSIII